MGTTHLQPIEFHNNYESDTLSFNTQILSFMGKNIALLDNLPTNPLTLNIDFAILFKNPSFSINELHQLAHFKEIIFDASNSLKSVKKWKEECKSLNIPYYDITEKGAWIKDL